MFDQSERYHQLQFWLGKELDTPSFELVPLKGDASFRRYFRAYKGDHRFIVMDAPPQKESCESFIAIANTFMQHDISVPEIYAADVSQGFLLLSDFGDRLYLDLLNPKTASKLYQLAFTELFKIQRIERIYGYQLPSFSTELYSNELELFRHWYLEQYKKIKLTAHEHDLLNQIFNLLIADALAQPQVCVHRDYHSRNLMLVAENRIGILDFQDALWGPVTYDLLSLLRDCYIDWPEEQVQKWLAEYYQATPILESFNFNQLLRWFDWIGLQRNLKCIGIFTRLHLRDNKPQYLNDIPRVLRYARLVCQRYPELESLQKYF